MKKHRYIFLLLCLIFWNFNSYAQQDPNNLFLVDVDNIYNTALAGKVLGMPNVGDRSLSAEETLMYQVLNCRWEDGKWVRYTANSNGKGVIKVGHPFLQPDGKRIFFISNIPGGAGGFDIYYSEKQNGKWTDPTNVGLKVNTPADELFPFVTSANILQIYRNSTQINYDLGELLNTQTTSRDNEPAVQKKPVIQIEKPVVKETPKPVTQVEKTPNISTTNTSQDIEYRVQLGAFSHPNWAVLNQLNDLGDFKTIKTSSGLTAVHLGSFKSLEEAKVLMNKVKQRPGFGNAYVVSVENEQIQNIYR